MLPCAEHHTDREEKNNMMVGKWFSTWTTEVVQQTSISRPPIVQVAQALWCYHVPNITQTEKKKIANTPHGCIYAFSTDINQPPIVQVVDFFFLPASKWLSEWEIDRHCPVVLTRIGYVTILHAMHRQAVASQVASISQLVHLSLTARSGWLAR